MNRLNICFPRFVSLQRKAAVPSADTFANLKALKLTRNITLFAKLVETSYHGQTGVPSIYRKKTVKDYYRTTVEN